MRIAMAVLTVALIAGCTTTTANNPEAPGVAPAADAKKADTPMVNLALKAVPNASTTQVKWEGEGPATHLNDGDLKTRWSSVFADASVKNPDVEKDNDQHVDLDLGKAADISLVRVHWETAAASNYTVQVSDNGTDWRQVDSRIGAAEGPRVDEFKLTKVNGRYLRLAFTARATKYGYSIYEIEVF